MAKFYLSYDKRFRDAVKLVAKKHDTNEREMWIMVRAVAMTMKNHLSYDEPPKDINVPGFGKFKRRFFWKKMLESYKGNFRNVENEAIDELIRD